MNNVVSFVPRASGGDWSAGERERLSDLADKLTAAGAKVDAAYGVSDAGDPWCVITDETDEVLIHVARIDGQIIIHDAAADAIQHDDTLWSAFERLMGPGWREGRDEGAVVPLRHAQSLLAVVAALLFVREITLESDSGPGHDVAAPSHTGLETPHEDILAAIPPSEEHTAAATSQTQAPEDVSPRRQALVAKSAETPVENPRAEPPTPVLAPAEASTHDAPASPLVLAEATPQALTAHDVVLTAGDHGSTLIGGAGNDRLQGGKGGDHLIAGSGNDTLDGGGARPGEIDLLEAGAGNDRLILGERTVAVGGSGHDVFVLPDEIAKTEVSTIHAPTPTAGVILDFTVLDKIELPRTATIVSVTPQVDVLEDMHGYATLAREPATAGVKVGVDLNGDGRADVFLMVAGSGASSLTVTTPPKSSAAVEPQEDHAGSHIDLTGHLNSASANGDLLLG